MNTISPVLMKAVSWALSGFVLSGCMAVKGPTFSDMGETYTEKIAEIERMDTTVDLILNVTHLANNEPTPRRRTSEQYQRVFQALLSKQEKFETIGFNVEDSDWSVQVDVRHHEKFNELLLAFSGATLGAIPSTVTLEFDADATVFDRSGKEYASFHAEQSVKLYISIMFFFPWRVGLTQKAQENLIKDIFLQTAFYIEAQERESL